ncbi:Pentapeptide repeat-containing protein (plasmid) [Nitratireductor aquimarinus]|uniref:pentapeptide repeat-containing protein n=1 Tax=Nitratireductor aquimarinus TaxID=889300 RepID=UPI003B593EBD
MKAAEIRALVCAPWRHGDCVDLSGIVCEGTLDLAGLDLTGVDFTGASFPDGIDATGTRFLGVSWFSNARFGGKTLFAHAVFTNDARFDQAIFAAEACFEGAEFRGIARFDRADFAMGANFQRIACYGNFSLHGVWVRGKASFQKAEWLGGLWCEAAQLPENADFADTQVHGRLWLRNALVGNRRLRSGTFPLSYGYTYN